MKKVTKKDKLLFASYNKENFIEIIEYMITTYNQIIFHQDIQAYLGIDHDTYYKYYKKFDESCKTRIDTLLKMNKSHTKMKLRDMWSDKNSTATTQIALYKLCAEKEELDILNNNVELKDDKNFNIEIKLPEFNK